MVRARDLPRRSGNTVAHESFEGVCARPGINNCYRTKIRYLSRFGYTFIRVDLCISEIILLPTRLRGTKRHGWWFKSRKRRKESRTCPILLARIFLLEIRFTAKDLPGAIPPAATYINLEKLIPQDKTVWRSGRREKMEGLFSLLFFFFFFFYKREAPRWLVYRGTINLKTIQFSPTVATRSSFHCRFFFRFFFLLASFRSSLHRSTIRNSWQFVTRSCPASFIPRLLEHWLEKNYLSCFRVSSYSRNLLYHLPMYKVHLLRLVFFFHGRVTSRIVLSSNRYVSSTTRSNVSKIFINSSLLEKQGTQDIRACV